MHCQWNRTVYPSRRSYPCSILRNANNVTEVLGLSTRNNIGRILTKKGNDFIVLPNFGLPLPPDKRAQAEDPDLYHHVGLEADASDPAKRLIPYNTERYRPQEARDLAERHEEHGTPVFRPQDDDLLATQTDDRTPIDLELADDDLSKRKELYGCGCTCNKVADDDDDGEVPPALCTSAAHPGEKSFLNRICLGKS